MITPSGELFCFSTNAKRYDWRNRADSEGYSADPALLRRDITEKYPYEKVFDTVPVNVKT